MSNNTLIAHNLNLYDIICIKDHSYENYPFTKISQELVDLIDEFGMELDDRPELNCAYIRRNGDGEIIARLDYLIDDLIDLRKVTVSFMAADQQDSPSEENKPKLATYGEAGWVATVEIIHEVSDDIWEAYVLKVVKTEKAPKTFNAPEEGHIFTISHRKLFPNCLGWSLVKHE